MNKPKDAIMNNPYKELSPYLESDASNFKGRTMEVEEMYESFDRNEYLVCHADSGEGKSSILEAGLIPKMKANSYFPIRIIFNSDKHFKNNSIDFDDVVCRIIDEEIGKFSENKSIVVNKVYPNRLTNSDEQELQEWEKELIENNAWLKLRYSRITIDNLLYTPVLIFDQFEEVFTSPFSQEWTDRFFVWLQELSTDLCPQRIVSEIEMHVGENDFPEISSKKYFKAIFSLRSEYVGKLDYWGMQRHYIPMLKSNRYLLRPLTIKGAKEVITGQEGYDGLNDVADSIVDVLRKLQKGKNYVESDISNLPCIPALLLSIVCSRAFNMPLEERSEFIQGLVANNDDEKEAAIHTLIAGFYEKAVSECGIPAGDMAIIEDVLVNSEGNRQRISSHADVLKTINFSSKYIKALEKARLIRVIPEYNREEDYVEIVHDCLCPIIAKRKEIQLTKEVEKRKAEIARIMKKQEKKILRMYRTIRILFLLPLALFSITFAYYRNEGTSFSEYIIRKYSFFGHTMIMGHPLKEALLSYFYIWLSLFLIVFIITYLILRRRTQWSRVGTCIRTIGYIVMAILIWFFIFWISFSVNTSVLYSNIIAVSVSTAIYIFIVAGKDVATSVIQKTKNLFIHENKR